MKTTSPMINITEDFSEHTLIKSIEASQRAFLEDLGHSPFVKLHKEPNLTWFLTGFPSPRYNRILHVQFDSDDVDKRIVSALKPFKQNKVPMIWHTGPSTRPPDIGRYLINHGLFYIGIETGMVIDLTQLPDVPTMPRGLEVIQVRDTSTLKQWSQTFAIGFDLPEGSNDNIFKIEESLNLSQHQNRLLFLGLLRNAPVATSLLFLGEGVAGLYDVATVPDARGQGFGKAISTLPLLEARTRGFRIDVLHATHMGLKIYRKLGFKAHCELKRYMWSGG